MRRSSALLLALVLALAAAPAARADFDLPVLMSVPERVQPLGQSVLEDMSADGRYTVFRVMADNVPSDGGYAPGGTPIRGGLWRTDTATGAIELVADGRYDGSGTFSSGARKASISADGRFVLFQTEAYNLRRDGTPERDGTTIRTYVRDMNEPLLGAAAFEPVVHPGRETAELTISLGGAISDDGRWVAYAVDKDVFVLDRAGGPPRLVSARFDFESGTMTNEQSEEFTEFAEGPVLSGDGTTVLWRSPSVRQTRTVGDANRGELLWRRIGDGPRAPTRLVASIGDPEGLGCTDTGARTTPAHDEPAGPCDGAFSGQDSLTGFPRRPGVVIPQPRETPEHSPGRLYDLSADGRKVVFVTTATPRGVPFEGERAASAQTVADAFVRTMYPGEPAAAATRELTRSPNGATDATGEPAVAVAIAPDGNHVAVTTARTSFTLPGFTFVGPPPAPAVETEFAGPSVAELFLFDLRRGTIELAARTPGGRKVETQTGYGAPQTGIGNGLPAAGGARVAFDATSDIFDPDDGNRFPDVYSAVPGVTLPGGDALGPELELRPTAPPAIADAPDWRLRIATQRASGRALELAVMAPAPGRVSVTATARVARGRAGTIATAAAAAGSDGRAVLRLRARGADQLGAALRALNGDGSDATLRIRFKPAGAGAPLERLVAARLPAPRGLRLSARLSRMRDGRLRVTARPPGAGRIVADARLRRAQRAFGHARCGADRKSTVRLTLAASRSARSALRRRADTVVVAVRFVPARGHRAAAAATLRLALPGGARR